MEKATCNCSIRIQSHKLHDSLTVLVLCVQVLKGLLKVDSADYRSMNQQQILPGAAANGAGAVSTPGAVFSPGSADTPAWAQQTAALKSEFHNPHSLASGFLAHKYLSNPYTHIDRHDLERWSISATCGACSVSLTLLCTRSRCTC
jgi:hypothetical protein